MPPLSSRATSGGERGRKLRSELGARHPGRCANEIEDAIQTACKRFLDKAEGISAPAEVYAWIRTTAHRQLNRRDERCEREIAVDPTLEGGLSEAVAADPTPEEEVIASEEEAELSGLVEEVASALPERRRKVLALYGAGCSRRQIGSRLGMSEGRVKRDLLEIMDKARAGLVRRAGGGCLRGEPLVVRFACGLTTPTGAERARRHLTRCRRRRLCRPQAMAATGSLSASRCTAPLSQAAWRSTSSFAIGRGSGSSCRRPRRGSLRVRDRSFGRSAWSTTGSGRSRSTRLGFSSTWRGKSNSTRPSSERMASRPTTRFLPPPRTVGMWISSSAAMRNRRSSARGQGTRSIGFSRCGIQPKTPSRGSRPGEISASGISVCAGAASSPKGDY